MAKRILWAFVLLSAVIGIAVAMDRMQVESQNRQVEMVFDLASAQQLAAVSDQELSQVLRALADAGVHSAAVLPRTVAEYGVAGRRIPDPIHGFWQDNHQYRELLSVQPVGFWEEDLEAVADAGLGVVPRIGNPPWDQEQMWEQAAVYDPHLVVFGGRQAPGYPDQLQQTAEKLAELGAYAGVVEFAAQQGIEAIAQSDRAVRVHGITAPEMRRLSPERVIARYMRAVRERNIRVLYLRGFVDEPADWDRTLQLVDTLSLSLTEEGYGLGFAAPFSQWSVSRAVLWTAWLGLAAATALFIGLWWVLPFPGELVLAGLVWIGIALVSLYDLRLAQTGAALAAAVIFPSLAVVRFPYLPGPRLRLMAETIAVSLAGALIVTVSLSDTDFMIKLSEFRGVKLMHVAPVAFAAVYGLFWRQVPVRRWALVVRRGEALWNQKVAVKHLILGAAAAGIGFVYLQRTGNFGLPVMEWEIQMREMLERVLLARPRSKELFLGHPALWLAGLSQGRWSWWLPLAAIGQLSLVNSFTHIHTPLLVSGLRTLYGLILGLILGWLLELIWKRTKGWWAYDRIVRLFRVR